MSRIAGASDSSLDTRGGSRSATLQPRGAAGTVDTRGEIRSTKLAERQMTVQIANIQATLHFLDEHGVKDGAVWFSYERASSFEDWVARNKAAMAGPRSLRQVLQSRLGSRLAELHALQDEVERLKRFEKLEAAARRARLLDETPAEATEDVARVARKFIRKLKRGSWDKGLEREVGAEMDRALYKWMHAVGKNPSVSNLKGLVHLVCESQKLGLSSDLSNRALLEFAAGVRKWMGAAESSFRQSPTADNFKKYMNAWGQSQRLGIDDEGRHTLAPKRLVGDGNYTVQGGDTLRSISRHFYGNDNQWDYIALSNFGKLRLLEPLRPGTHLTIPSR